MSEPKLFGIRRHIRTPEEAQKDAAKQQEWEREQAELERTRVPRKIQKLREEAQASSEQADSLERLSIAYTDLREQSSRWGKITYYSPTVNALVTKADIRHNCGCCSDSPIEVFPYLETPDGPVYSDPPKFIVGERCYDGGDRPYDGWEDKLRNTGVSEAAVLVVQAYFDAHPPCDEDSDDEDS